MDFFSLDVEGAELEVLLTMNFNAVVVEVSLGSYPSPMETQKGRVCTALLSEKGFAQFHVFSSSKNHCRADAEKLIIPMRLLVAFRITSDWRHKWITPL